MAIDPSLPDLVLMALAVAVAYTVFGFSGFGAALVSLPVLVHVVPVRVAVPLLLVMDLSTAGLMGLRNRPQIDTAELKRLLPWLALGMLGGTLALSRGSERVLLIVLGGFVLGFALHNLFSRAAPQLVSPRWAVPAGLVGGAFSAVFGTGGPVYTLYLARRLPDTARLRATVAAIILGAALGRLLLFTTSGLLLQPGLLKTALWLLPGALIGCALGSRWQARVPQALVRRIIWGLLVASGASVLWRGLSVPAGG